MNIEDRNMEIGDSQLRWQHGTGSHSGGVNLEPGVEVAKVMRKYNLWKSTTVKVLAAMGYGENHINKILEVAYAN